MYPWLPIREIPLSMEPQFSEKVNQRSSNSIAWELVKKAKFSSPNSDRVTQKLWGWAPAMWVSWCAATVTHFINKRAPNVFVPNIRCLCRHVCHVVLEPWLQTVNIHIRDKVSICIRDKGKTPHTETGLLAVLDPLTLGPVPWPFLCLEHCPFRSHPI